MQRTATSSGAHSQVKMAVRFLHTRSLDDLIVGDESYCGAGGEEQRARVHPFLPDHLLCPTVDGCAAMRGQEVVPGHGQNIPVGGGLAGAPPLAPPAGQLRAQAALAAEHPVQLHAVSLVVTVHTRLLLGVELRNKKGQ